MGHLSSTYFLAAHENVSVCRVPGGWNIPNHITQSISLFILKNQSKNAGLYRGRDVFLRVIEPYIAKRWPLMTWMYVCMGPI
jgi:hypothetical protein